MTDRKITSDIFSNLIWDDKLEWWTGRTEINPGHIVDIALESTDTDSIEILNDINAKFVCIKASEIYFRVAATSVMLDIYNKSWNDGEDIDKKTFLELINLESIVFYCDGSVELYYNDGNLFGGHTILVSVDDRGKFSKATIAG